MYKKPSTPQSNIFSIFIVIVGLLVIGMVVFINQQEPPKTVDTVAQGGSPESDSEIIAALNKSTTATDIVDEINTNNTETKTVENSEADSTAEDTNSTEPELAILQTATTTSQGEITTYQFGNGDVVNVMNPEFESLVLNETSIVASEPVTIGSQVGEKITIESAKDGSEIVIIHIITDDTLYDIRGSADFINNITNYINFN